MSTLNQPNSQSTTPKRVSKMTANQSLNHLLNFSLPPRQTHQLQSLPRRTRKTGNQQGVWNKEKFVNAQYRFVMNPSGDYTVHFADPDIFFLWPDILQVIIPRTSAVASAAGSGDRAAEQEGVTTCPICLSPPNAPRMTKCGHVFCFPCILHYLNTSDSLKWVRCPICFDSVNERQLKAVKWFDGPPAVEEDVEDNLQTASSSTTVDDGLVYTPHPGSTIRMRLMQRPTITTLALPRSQTWPSDLIPPHQAPFHFLPDVFGFSKFMLATPDYLIADLTRDLDELNVERRILTSMGDDLGVHFVDAAETKLRHQIAKASALETPQLKEAVDAALRLQQQIEDRVNMHQHRNIKEERTVGPPTEDVPEAFLATRPIGFDSPVHAASPAPSALPPKGPTTPSRNPRLRRNVNPPPPSTSTYYYYQSAEGMPIFLHPLDIKILLTHYSSYAAFPNTITVRVEAYTESTVNDDLRKRCKYLAHLPAGADVVFIEADLSGVVGTEGLRNFEGALKLRRGRRRERGRKEDNARVRAEMRARERVQERWHEEGYVALTPVGHPTREAEELQEHVVTEVQPQVPGAWGARSFASAAQQGRAPGIPGQRTVPRQQVREEDEWDLDVAFHELEQRGGRSGGGGGKRRNKLVVLGGAGGRRG